MTSLRTQAALLEHVARDTAPRSIDTIMADIAASTERMIAMQMEVYPADWSDADKREMAVRHLFGRPA